MNNNQHSSEYMSRPNATSPDMTRPVATGDDYISIKEARAIFKSRDRSVTERTLQRYCEKHYLDGQKRITAEGEKWFVLKSSVLTRIAELEEFDRLRPATTNSDMSGVVVEEMQSRDTPDMQRHVATEHMSVPVESSEQSHTSSSDLSRHGAASRDISNERETVSQDKDHVLSASERELYERVIEHLQKENDLQQRIMQRYEIENGGLRDDKEKLYMLLESSNEEKRMLIAGDRDSKEVMKNNNSLIAYLSQFFKGKEQIASPKTDPSYQSSTLTDVLAGDERAN